MHCVDIDGLGVYFIYDVSYEVGLNRFMNVSLIAYVSVLLNDDGATKKFTY